MRADRLQLPRVTSIVLSWNRLQDTLACLAALTAPTPSCRHQVLVVDNGSTDGTAEAVRRQFPEVTVLVLPENRGFAAGMNVGLRRALEDGADWTWLVNNDVVVGPATLGELLAAAGGPKVGLVTPTVYYAGRPGQVWPSAGWRRHLTLAAFDTSAQPPSSDPYEVDWAAACCLLVRRQVWQTVGLLDERFFVYYEDHDLCLRARAAGWRILHVPSARVEHRVSASTGPGSPAQVYLLARSSVPFYLKHTRGLHRALMVPYRLGSLARWLGRELAAGRPAVARAYLQGIVDGLRDAWGGRGKVDGATAAWPAEGGS